MTELLMAAWVGTAVAGARFKPTAQEVGQPPTLQSYLDDLTGSNKGDRLLAARSLRRQVKAALRSANRGPADSFGVQEALVQLEEYDARLAPRCISALERIDTLAPCADILGMLETQDALDALERSLQIATRRGTNRRVDRAVARIQAAAPAEE